MVVRGRPAVPHGPAASETRGPGVPVRPGVPARTGAQVRPARGQPVKWRVHGTQPAAQAVPPPRQRLLRRWRRRCRRCRRRRCCSRSRSRRRCCCRRCRPRRLGTPPPGGPCGRSHRGPQSRPAPGAAVAVQALHGAQRHMWCRDELPGTKGGVGTVLEPIGWGSRRGRAVERGLRAYACSCKMGRSAASCDPDNSSLAVEQCRATDPVRLLACLARADGPVSGLRRLGRGRLARGAESAGQIQHHQGNDANSEGACNSRAGVAAPNTVGWREQRRQRRQWLAEGQA